MHETCAACRASLEGRWLAVLYEASLRGLEISIVILVLRFLRWGADVFKVIIRDISGLCISVH